MQHFSEKALAKSKESLATKNPPEGRRFASKKKDIT